MRCRHCGRKLPEGTTYCSRCKKNNFAKWQIIVGIVGAVLVLAGLAVVLIAGMDFDALKKTTPTVETAPVYQAVMDYIGTDEERAENADVVVATANGAQLTNRQLQLYYNMEVYKFVSENYYDLASYGLDYTQPLVNQQCYFEDISWQEYFTHEAINTWHKYQIIRWYAEEDGFKFSEDTQEMLDNMETDIKASATEDGYTDVNEWLVYTYKADITYEDYAEYVLLTAYYSEYLAKEPTAEELDAFYQENEAYFVENSIDKESGVIASVRHILIQPKSASGDGTYTDEEWAACKSEATKILNEWRSGAATEDTFASMAKLYSADTGSTENGGLYTDITKDSGYVEEFENWCIDPSRRIGDTGLIKTEYGYHIMYYSGGTPLWEYYAKQMYAEDLMYRLVESGAAQWPVEISKDAICINEIDLVGE